MSISLGCKLPGNYPGDSGNSLDYRAFGLGRLILAKLNLAILLVQNVLPVQELPVLYPPPTFSM